MTKTRLQYNKLSFFSHTFFIYSTISLDTSEPKTSKVGEE